MEDCLSASDIRKFSGVFLIAVLLVIPILYLSLGCRVDWLVIAGLFVDAIGAVLLAAPELGFFRMYTYSGSIRDALDELSGTSDTWVREEAAWYPVFLEEMKEVLSTTEIPNTAEFRIERNKNSNLLYYMPNPGVEDETPLNLFNVFSPLRDTIEEEERQIRRSGAAIFVAGILFQIVGLLYNTVVFPSVFC